MTPQNNQFFFLYKQLRTFFNHINLVINNPSS